MSTVFDRMTESKEATTKFRAYCISKKKEVWEKLIEHAKEAKNIEKVYDMTTVLQQVEQEVCVFAMTNGIGKPDIYDACELVYPLAMRPVLIKVLKPYFFSHWAIFRLAGYSENRKIDHGIRLDPELVTEEKKESYKQYVDDFNAFVHELKSGKVHANRHLIPAISSYIRELAASMVMHEKAAFDGELRCSMLQEIMEQLRIWSSIITMEEAYHFIKDTIYKDIIQMLSRHIYEMVAVNFPVKFREIITMKYCLQQTNNYGREELTFNLIRNVQKKLLVASVDTKTILEAYAACVESLREMDNSCVVMHKVCGVIREYLKRRPDTVQQIITYITSSKKEELEKDMAKTVRSAMMDEDELRGVNVDYLPENMDITGWDHWMPNPNDAVVGDGAPARQGVDVFNMLVSVYGSKELFVKEYRVLLAERLSASGEKNPAFEKRYLDLLKLRFQYSELQHCEVMLRDVVDSQRMDESIELRREPEHIPITSCITSKHYWPRLDTDTSEGKMPECLNEALHNYQELYMQESNRRRVEIYKTVGSLDVSIELDGVQVDRTIPNIYAHTLFLFLESETWTTNEVMNRLKVNIVNAKKRLEWLVKQGFLMMNPLVSSDTWYLTRNASTILPNRSGTPEPEDEDIEQEDSSEMVDALEQYWGYTRNYIANHAPNGEVKAERMHRVYRMFGSPSSAGPNIDHVTAFLQRKVALGLLTCINGSYRVVKEDKKTKEGE